MRHVSTARGLFATPIASQVRRYAAAAEASPILLQNHPAPHSGTIRVLLLDKADTRNALSKRLVKDLRRHVDEIKAEGGTGGTRALIIASNVDKAFCAGADLKERRSMSQEDVSAFLKDLRSTFTELSKLPIPTISAISSTALGGGLELGLCTNLRVFCSTATVGLPETRLAIIPGAGGTFRLPALIGPNRARDMILTGRRVLGPEAYFLGLCDRLVQVTEEEQSQEGKAREKVLEVSLQLARDICEGGPVALKAAMQAVDGWQKGEASENAAYDIVLKTEDRLEALRAFAEKRKPAFKGR
ncbi:Methylglutaconyl-CoA hydratase, mitochondrial [Cyphellophora attinorum]|uniref:Methylglutaconyl-CoA hydratase, mitochondrial n=1 Tax=Cyphellophora attinorum TaxID=1664694 RepID=A0A0N1NXJ2_9EURO|nr:Methylglutaconyl-CoA hydratase, mitochondrial [Phialophora attinorum]KPI37452.1 Methylglutaconyl-CoA hydratase, mitochondrial [Phialophora attinorum]